MEPEAAGGALLRGAVHVLALVAAYLAENDRAHLLGLADRYDARSPS